MSHRPQNRPDNLKRCAAYAQFELTRIRRANVTSINRMEIAEDTLPPEGTSSGPMSLQDNAFDELSKLERYERRSRKMLADALTRIIARK